MFYFLIAFFFEGRYLEADPHPTHISPVTHPFPLIRTRAHRSGRKGPVLPKNPTVALPHCAPRLTPPLCSPHDPSFRLKLASLNGSEVLTQPSACWLFEINTPNVSQLCFCLRSGFSFFLLCLALVAVLNLWYDKVPDDLRKYHFFNS